MSTSRASASARLNRGLEKRHVRNYSESDANYDISPEYEHLINNISRPNISVPSPGSSSTGTPPGINSTASIFLSPSETKDVDSDWKQKSEGLDDVQRVPRNVPTRGRTHTRFKFPSANWAGISLAGRASSLLTSQRKRKQSHDYTTSSGRTQNLLEAFDIAELDNNQYASRRKPSLVSVMMRFGFMFLGIVWGICFIAYIYVALKSTNYIVPTPIHSYNRGTEHNENPITLDDVRDGKFFSSVQPITFVETLDDNTDDKGWYIKDNSQRFILKRMTDNEEKVIYEKDNFVYNGMIYYIDSMIPNRDLTKAIIRTDVQEEYRYSSVAFYWILDIDSKLIIPLYPNSHDKLIKLAIWSPLSDEIAFVFENDIYIRKLKKENSEELIRITNDGSPDIIYGTPDWVYEEEVFGTNIGMWWSPNGKYLAALKTNDTLVPEYPMPYFTTEKNAYPRFYKLKYPKPGFNNPTVEVGIVNVRDGSIFFLPDDDPIRDDIDSIVTEVIWVGVERLLLRISNRASDIMKICLVDVTSQYANGRIMRTLTSKDGGWFEPTQSTVYIQSDSSNNRPHDGYLETVAVHDFYHLVYFNSSESSSGKVLTSGDWEVTSRPVFNAVANRIYFLAAKKSSMERHLYSIGLNGETLLEISNTSEEAWYNVLFSSGGRFAILNYEGPGIPNQKILDFLTDEPYEKAKIIEKNEDLEQVLERLNVPTTEYGQIEVSSGIFANYREIKPDGFNSSQLYPVIFYVYGGPNSQSVSKTHLISYSHALASALNVIIITVDGRGTGNRGLAYRSIVRKNLGYYESSDQIAAAKIWAKKSYVDENNIAIWGWSYGGYLTLKALEVDKGQTFKYGIAVAPVTDWKFYDSIYTERYMLTPEDNPEGYSKSSFANVESFSKVKRFMIMHGTADDNVHFQNTLTLIDKFNVAGVKNFDLFIFPDSDHNINHHNSKKIIYERITDWLGNAFQGDFL